MTSALSSPALAGSEPVARPYPPSWVNRLVAWVDRLPFAWWLFYLMLGLLFNGCVLLSLRLTGVSAAVGFHPMQVWLPTLSAYFLFMMHVLDHSARSAMRRFERAFQGTELELEDQLYRLTTLPARPAFILTFVLAPVLVPLGMVEFEFLDMGGLNMVAGIYVGTVLLLYLCSLPWFYYVWHQLRQINRIYRDHSRVRLEDIRPIHALSRVTATTALAIAAFNYGWILAQPGTDLSNPVFLGEGLFGLSLALIVFILPLWGAHQKLAEAKEHALSDLGVRKHGIRERMKTAAEQDQFQLIDPLNKALAALQAEYEEVHALPTWPWAAGTLRNLLGAVLLPIVLWLVQFGLGRLLE